jgi:FAD/FMN-containing dehydrogenase
VISDWSALSDTLDGPLTRPGTDGFDADNTGFDLAVRHRPDASVGATGPDDIRAAVRFAGTHQLPVGVVATGHGATVAADGGLMINTRRLNAVQVDAPACTASVQAGATWGQVVQACAPHGLAPLCGAAPGVGAVGYTIGGGIGVLGRRYGFAADHVRRFGLVTADGEHRDVTPEQQPDLFWGVRGGVGNFGVVTDLEIELMPVPDFYAGGLFFAGRDAAEVLAAFLECTTNAPDELSLSVALVRFPDLAVLPPPLRGQFCVHVRVTHLGTDSAGERLIAALRRVGPPLLDSVRRLPFSEVGTIHSDPVGPMEVTTRSVVLTHLDDAALHTVLDYSGVTSPFMIELRQLGGALGRPPAIPNSVGHRQGTFNLFTSAYPSPSGTALAGAAQQRFIDDLAPWSAGGALVNFLTGSHVTLEDVCTAYDPADWVRLRALKTTWDPSNLFRFNQNIPPNG